MKRRTFGLGAAAAVATGFMAQQAHAAPPRVTIRPGDPRACDGDPHFTKHQMRGLWIASVVNIDWPSKAGISAEQAQKELLDYFDMAVEMNLNTIFLQVRPTADTFWKSDLEPWSQYLTGTQGKDPGWDPLGFAVEHAHARGLELHAWMNPYRIAMDEAGKALVKEHPARVHPEWTLPYGGKLYYNPGLPEARKHVVATILEAVEKYDVDAIHFDDYFYPYPVAGKVFDDSEVYAKYGNGMSLGDWRRHNIDLLINEVREGVRSIRPGTQLGVSPFGVWRNKATDPEGSATQAGVQTYDNLYADTRKWTREGMVDYMLPQIYWSRTLAAASYEAVATWWAAEAARSPRCNVYIGEGAYKIGANSDKAWDNPREMTSHLEYVAELNDRYGRDVIQGNVYYNATTTRQNLLDGIGITVREWYGKPALTPRMPWLDATAPAAPSVRRRGGRLEISGASDVWQYVIYRVPKKAKDVQACDLADTRHVVAIVTGDVRNWTDPEVTEDFGQYTWLVSAVDRGSNESVATVAR